MNDNALPANQSGTRPVSLHCKPDSGHVAPAAAGQGCATVEITAITIITQREITHA